MKYIIYLSSASIYFQPETLKEMLIHFRKNNEVNQITGMMLFSDGSFLQVLEGENVNIDNLIKKIKKDNRHHSLVQIAEESISERNFSKWSMGFRTVSPEEFKALKGYIDPWDPDFLSALPRNQQHPALELLKAFAQNSQMR